MNRHVIRIAPALFALATGAAAATYPVRHLDPGDALMALHVRVPELGMDCNVSVSHAKDPKTVGFQGVLAIICGTETLQAKIQPALDIIDAQPPTQRFHIAVLSASRAEGPVPEVLPAEAKALNDFKKVMTYKSFKVEAETILHSDREAETQLNGSYILELAINPNTGGRDTIEVRRFRLRAVNAQISSTGAQSFPTYIDTSFSVKKGETIVLGTSVSDQQARVVLVTALP